MQSVVLLHGLMRGPLTMVPLRRYLTRRGFDVHNFHYRSTRYQIDPLIEQLSSYIDQRIAKDSPPPYFVGHSMGSIIALGYLTTRIPNQKSRLVMLGPPNQGSSLAAKLAKSRALCALLGPGFCELRDPACFKLSANQQVGIIAGTRGATGGYNPLLAAPNDGIVTAIETRLDGATQWHQLTGIHAFLMLQPLVMKLTCQFLQTGEFDLNIS